MVRVGQRTGGGTMAPLRSHTVSVRRRSGDSFSPVPAGGQVLPNEAIRYFASSVLWGATVRFVVTGPAGVILEEEVPVNFQQDAWLDTVAPSALGQYVFSAHARSYPFLPWSHLASISFSVDPAAPNPPPPPPDSGFFKGLGALKGLLIVAGVVVAIVALAPVVGRIGRRVVEN